MNKFLFILLTLLIVSCDVDNSQEDKRYSEKSDTDWSHSSSCNSPADPEFFDFIINNMTLEQKVGQIIMPDIDEVTPQEAKDYYLGSFLNGGGKFPNKNKNSSINDWKDLSEDFYNASPIVGDITIPILWGTDAVHGHNNVIGATIFPHNIGLGSTMNPSLIQEIGGAVAKELLSTGIAWTFAPTITVPQNDLWGRTYEGYSENPELVAQLGQAMIIGLQGEGDSYLDNNHVLSTAKHFIGDGGTLNGEDQGNTVISESELKNIHGLPYYFAIDSCIQTIMASFNSWNGSKLHGNKYLLTDVLKDKMQFNGLIVGDWNGHGQLPGCTNSDCAASFNAGVDIFMAPDEWKGLYVNTLNQLKNGSIKEERLDDAIRRILRVKNILGLFDGRKPHIFNENYIGSDKHREIARRSVRESIVLLKNNDNVLPLNPKKHYLVVGQASKDIKNQMGGWTISWQGRDNLNSEFPNTRSIFETIKYTLEKSGGSVEFSSDGSYKIKPDAVIMVYGEEPYAEGDGDRDSIIFNNPNKNFFLVMKEVVSKELPIISLFISGRPLVVNRELNASNAFVQLWLPGTAVEGITDVIFSNKDGSINHDFKGKLSYSWPEKSNQLNLNLNDKNYYPLFKYGYGLTYKDDINLDKYNEERPQIELDEVVFFIGSAFPPNNEFIIESGKKSKVNADFYESPNKLISLRKMDYLKQDDAKNISFQYGINSWGIENQYSDNFSYMKNGLLEIKYRLNSKLNIKSNSFILLESKCKKNDYQIHMSGDSECDVVFDISKNLITSDQQEWDSLNIPLKCFVENGLETSSVTSMISLKANIPIDIDIHSIKLINKSDKSEIIDCSNFRLAS